MASCKGCFPSCGHVLPTLPGGGYPDSATQERGPSTFQGTTDPHPLLWQMAGRRSSQEHTQSQANIALSSREASYKSLDPASWQQGHSRYGEGLLAMSRAMVM
ncbi:unnamed protein product [Rangifer tarandus platyrhynchus]|uniref:Uncharacterized protein n=1 Tax=Rangifer tarandus platyrhynchus TaxID=3082113 RepID=A0AC59ZDX0_RANTA